MQQLESSLKAGLLCPVYLFWGDEGLLMADAVRRISALAQPQGGSDWSRELLDGAECDPAAVAAAANSASFLAERRLVLVRRAPWFRVKRRKGEEADTDSSEPAAYDIEPLLEYVRDPNPDTVLIIEAEGTVPKNSRIYKAVSQSGRAVEFISPRGSAREQWLKNYLREQGKVLEPGVASYLCLMCGEGLAMLKSEADKLVLYAEGSRITQADAEAVVSHSSLSGVFELTDAAVGRHTASAVATLRRLLTQGEPAPRLLALLADQFRHILLVREMTAHGFTPPQIASTAGINPYVVKKCAAARAYDSRRLLRALELLLAVDIDTKSGRAEMETALELAIMRICSL